MVPATNLRLILTVLSGSPVCYPGELDTGALSRAGSAGPLRSVPPCPHIKTALLVDSRRRYSSMKHCCLSFPRPSPTDSIKGEVDIKIHLNLKGPERFYSGVSITQEANKPTKRKKDQVGPISIKSRWCQTLVGPEITVFDWYLAYSILPYREVPKSSNKNSNTSFKIAYCCM